MSALYYDALFIWALCRATYQLSKSDERFLIIPVLPLLSKLRPAPAALYTNDVPVSTCTHCIQLMYHSCDVILYVGHQVPACCCQGCQHLPCATERGFAGDIGALEVWLIEGLRYIMPRTRTSLNSIHHQSDLACSKSVVKRSQYEEDTTLHTIVGFFSPTCITSSKEQTVRYNTAWIN